MSDCSRYSETPACNNGLPLDLWRVVLSYLGVVDLCTASQVCRSWRYLVASLDVSSWRSYFLDSYEWKHPSWPMLLNDVPPNRQTWQTLCRKHVILSRLWAYPAKNVHQSKCFVPLFSKGDRKVIAVGPQCQFKTLRSALDGAAPYDRILIHPGIYDEQFEISSKIPFELVGHGPPGSVILMISVEQNALTGRLCNLYIKAPWFTSHVLKISSGHLQVDNCEFDDSQVAVDHPATCHFRYCSFHRVHVTFNHVNSAVIENCLFRNCSVNVQGYPKQQNCWASTHLISLTNTWDRKSSETQGTSSAYNLYSTTCSSSLRTAESTKTSSAFQVNHSETDSIGVASIVDFFDENDAESSYSYNESSHVSINSFSSLSGQHSQGSQNDISSKLNENLQLANSDDKDPTHDKSADLETSCANHPASISQVNAQACESTETDDTTAADMHNTLSDAPGQINPEPAESDPGCINDLWSAVARRRVPQPRRVPHELSLRVVNISSRSRHNMQRLPAPEELARSSSESDEGECSTTTSTNLSLIDAPGHVSPPWSSDNESVIEAQIQTSFREALAKDSELLDMIYEIKGPVFRNCILRNGQDGLKVSSQGQCRIEHCLLKELQFGIRCLQNARVAVLENEICMCSASGIYMRLAAHGIIAGNDIYCTREAVVDIRRQADPLIQCNRIHHSKRSGIVVLGSGGGLIRGNDIYSNREAAIYVLYRGNPYIIANRICHGQASGVTVCHNGRGVIVDNYIAHNRWAGVDIRSGSDPLVCRNTICQGLANGVVVSHGGRGLIDANTIKGNDGCGVYSVDSFPLVQSNQIYNNNDCGVAFMHDTSGSSADSADGQSDCSELSDEFDTSSMADDRLDSTNQYLTTPRLYHRPAGTRPQQAKLCFNTVFHNNGYGVLCSSDTALEIHGNACHSNKDTGVMVKQTRGHVAITCNSITSNAGSGVQVSEGASVEIEGNGIYENRGHGLLLTGSVKVASNDIFSNARSAINVQDQATLECHGNRLEAANSCAVVELSKMPSRDSISHNQFYATVRRMPEAPVAQIEDSANSVESAGTMLTPKILNKTSDSFPSVLGQVTDNGYTSHVDIPLYVEGTEGFKDTEGFKHAEGFKSTDTNDANKGTQGLGGFTSSNAVITLRRGNTEGAAKPILEGITVDVTSHFIVDSINTLVTVDQDTVAPGSWHLEDPGPRPHLVPPEPHAVPRVPTMHRSAPTRVSVPPSDALRATSGFCAIL